MLPQFSRGHIQTPKVASNYLAITASAKHVQVTENYCKLFSPLTVKNVSWKKRHNKNILRLKTLKNEYSISSKNYCFFYKRT